MINLDDEESVKKALRKALGREPREDIWEELVNLSYVSDAIIDGEIDNVLEHYTEQDERYPLQRSAKPKIRSFVSEPPDERLQYIWKILAWDAEHEPEVISFRQEVLDNKLISENKVLDWINKLKNKEQPKDILKTKSIKFSFKASPHMAIELANAGGKIDADIDLKSVNTPNKTEGKTILIPYGGILGRLFKLSEHLRSRYDWRESEAVKLILSGIAPKPLLGYGSISSHPFYQSLNKIDLKISIHLSQNEVARVYSKFRSQLSPLFQNRNRPMSEKHIQLAFFYHTHKPMKYREMMIIWNGEHPSKNPYIQVTNFARDAKHAHLRLLGLKQ